MAEKVLIASDSTCDLSSELIEKYGIKILPLGVTLGETTYTDGVDINPDMIYANYEKTGELPKTSAVNIADFEDFFENVNLTSNDFMFLDPPYDTDFSDYEGKDFTKFDQERLAHALKKTLAKFILVIKNTDFINGLYEKDFNILSFDKQYTYNVRSRNDRDVEHLIITNLSV